MFSNKILLIMTIYFMNFALFSQENELRYLTAESDYLGYSKPGSIPEIFAPDFISTQFAEFAGTFSPDFTEYYFTRRGPFPGGLAQIMVTRKINESWTAPFVAAFSSNNYEFEPYITPDGMRLYFGSRRSVDGTAPPGEMHQWYLDKQDSTWSEPILLGSPFFERMVMYPTVSNNKTFYFTSLDGIYYSEFINDVYQEPIKMGSEINFLPLTAHSFIAPDEGYLIFDGQPRGEGKTDIFISYKKQDGFWTKGKFMGKEINSGESQAMASVSPDGECFFFTRDSDIYWVDASVIDQIRLIPEVTLEPDTGTIPLTVQFYVDLNTVPDSIIEFEWDFTNDGVIDSREQNPEYTYLEAGIYSVRLCVFTLTDSASIVLNDIVEVFDESTGFRLDDKNHFSDYELCQNYPNPFNPTTKISYSIPQELKVNANIVDVLGTKIITLVDEEKKTGYHEVRFDAKDLSSGIYYYQFIAGNYSETKKMILVR
jgi:hypothetical protein